MLYSKEFIASIKGAPASGVVKACAMAFEKLGAKGTWDEESYNVLSEAYALVASVIEAGLIDIKEVSAPALRGRLHDDCVGINQYLLNVRKECHMLVQLERIELLKARTRQTLGVEAGSVPDACYQFEGQEINRLRSLIGEMAQSLGRCTELDKRLHARLLRRLQAIERDLKDAMTEWDRFWGLIGETRLLLSQCGESARQFVRGVSEMTQIVGVAQVRAAGLPAHHRLAMLSLDHD